MQIELIGCTSAGKSTLTRNILQACREQGINLSMADDFVLKQVRLDWVKINPVRKLLVNMVALSACLATWQKNLAFYIFAIRVLLQLPIALLEKLYSVRNVFKRIGTYEIIRRRKTDRQVLLVDEGTLQSAHNLFANFSVEMKTDDLSTFVKLTPQPDVVIYVKEHEPVLIERTIKRGHKRIPDRSYHNVAPFIKQAVATFDKLAQHPAVANKLLIIDSDQNVIMASKDQDDPRMALALNIIRSGFTGDPSCQPAKILYVE